jgi:hypothetical protein
VLSEVIDAILDVRQADRRVPGSQALHAELDLLFADLRAWARLLADADQALGVSPLASMPSAAGRTPPHPGHGAASNEEVRRIVGEHLDRLGQHLSAAPAEQQDDQVRAALTEVERGIPHAQASSSADSSNTLEFSSIRPANLIRQRKLADTALNRQKRAVRLPLEVICLRRGLCDAEGRAVWGVEWSGRLTLCATA